MTFRSPLIDVPDIVTHTQSNYNPCLLQEKVAGDHAGEYKRYREPHLLPRLIGGCTDSPGTGKALVVTCCPLKMKVCRVPDTLFTLGPKIHQWTLDSLPNHGNSEGWNSRNWNQVRPIVGCLYCLLSILEWPFIVHSLRHTCAIIMLSFQHLEIPHL